MPSMRQYFKNELNTFWLMVRQRVVRQPGRTGQGFQLALGGGPARLDLVFAELAIFGLRVFLVQ